MKKITKRPKENLKHHLYGIVTVGEKGQVVIPHEARKKMNLKKGAKLVVFEAHEGTLAFASITAMEKAASELSKYVASLKARK